MDLDSDGDDSLLVRFTTTNARFLTADIRFIDFHGTAEAISSGTNHGTPHLVQPSPCGLVASEPDSPLETQSVPTEFLARHVPHSLKPSAERLSRTFENRSSRDGSLSFTRRAEHVLSCGKPGLTSSTYRTDEASWPSNAFEIGEALGIRGKPLVKFLECARVIHAAHWIGLIGAHRYILCQLERSGYPPFLKKPRDKLNIKGTGYTHPNKALLSQIPIRTFGDWKNIPPGHFQLDCVGHDGGIPSGQCCFTLTAVDVYSGWCERRGLLNRAHKWVIEALDLMRADCPLRFVEIHPDNGSEFINHAMVKYCENNLNITRSRPGKKNDNCYVEQKNFDAVRKLVGYARYTTPEALWLLNEIYRVQGVLQNYIYPAFKLIEKRRVGSKYIKKYDSPKTPAMRLLEDPRTNRNIKKKIQLTLESLNPVALALEVNNLQEKLFEHAEVLTSAYPQGKGA